MVGRVVN